MAKRALLILADGAEEMEAVITIDTLRRGGVRFRSINCEFTLNNTILQIDVTVAGLNGDAEVKCSRSVVIRPDTSLTAALAQSPYDAVILPGGLKGAEALADSAVVGELLKKHEEDGRIVAAICAGQC